MDGKEQLMEQWIIYKVRFQQRETNAKMEVMKSNLNYIERISVKSSFIERPNSGSLVTIAIYLAHLNPVTMHAEIIRDYQKDDVVVCH